MDNTPRNSHPHLTIGEKNTYKKRANSKTTQLTFKTSNHLTGGSLHLSSVRQSKGPQGKRQKGAFPENRWFIKQVKERRQSRAARAVEPAIASSKC